jgi:cell division protein FtsB
MNKNWFQKFKEFIEQKLPMSFNSLLIFGFVLYLFFVVGKSIMVSYGSNKELENEAQKIQALESEIVLMKNQIAYYRTTSFKEKEARQKLGYKASGESLMSLPLDKDEDKVVDTELGEVPIKTPNYRLWWRYLTEK